LKLTILGAAGVRTPLIVESIIHRQERLGITDLALMDIDADHMEIIGALTEPLEKKARFQIHRTTDSRQALKDADYVITTFRVGGIDSRVIDERVPLSHGVLGQETTGPGGFAMGLRSIPVLLKYVDEMRQLCPRAWLLNFANPAGMMAEAVSRQASWERVVGICDSPGQMQRVAAAVIGAPVEAVFLDYFGLNHLGWIRRIEYQGKDYLPELIHMLQEAGGMPGLPFDPDLIASLGMVPNEYLYYYYYARQAVDHILQSGQTRGEQIAGLNNRLFKELALILDSPVNETAEKLNAAYQGYMNNRSETYMVSETGKHHTFEDFHFLNPQALEGEGYAGVALDLIEALSGKKPGIMIVNVPNHGAIHGMHIEDVVEIPVHASQKGLLPIAVGEIPDLALGLMKQVKAYERMTIEAAAQGSYQKALLGLTIHPLVRDYSLAQTILDEYLQQHGEYFPALS
jgi:6-phospho-beta-glucosidase